MLEISVLATRGDNEFLVDIGNELGQVVSLDEGEAFLPFRLQSILARGYWEPVTELLPAKLVEILRLAEEARNTVELSSIEYL